MVSLAYAGCGVDTNPYDDIPGSLPNGYYPPIADFSCDHIQGYAPLTVSFTDQSTNIPTDWAWNFGDGMSSNIKNPIHIYTAPGRYTVSLTAGNGYGGNSITKSDYVVVDSASSTPLVDFSANVTSGYAPLHVEFTDLSTGGIIMTRQWTFNNNGSTVSETTSDRKIIHNFAESGLYNVSLTVAAENNGSATLEKLYCISVKKPAPEEGTIILHPGWNLIATPLPLKSQYCTAGQVFATIDTDSRSIFSYDAVSEQFVPLNSNSVIFPLEGIWVYSKSEIPLTFKYQVTRPLSITMHMPAGWNLVGYPSIEPGNSREGFVSINNIWTIILCFDPVMQQYSSSIFNEGLGEQGDQHLMYPMNGYWIFMPQQGDLTITIS
jgi:PKD repeat protein